MAILRYAFLRYSSLRYGYLGYGYLHYASLCYAFLRYASLRYASFRDGHLQNRLVAIQLWTILFQILIIEFCHRYTSIIRNPRPQCTRQSKLCHPVNHLPFHRKRCILVRKRRCCRSTLSKARRGTRYLKY